MSDQLAKYELHIFNDTLFISNLIGKMPPFYSTKLAFKWNLRNLNKGHCNIKALNCKNLKLLSSSAVISNQKTDEKVIQYIQPLMPNCPQYLIFHFQSNDSLLCVFSSNIQL